MLHSLRRHTVKYTTTITVRLASPDCPDCPDWQRLLLLLFCILFISFYFCIIFALHSYLFISIANAQALALFNCTCIILLKIQLLQRLPRRSSLTEFMDISVRFGSARLSSVHFGSFRFISYAGGSLKNRFKRIRLCVWYIILTSFHCVLVFVKCAFKALTCIFMSLAGMCRLWSLWQRYINMEWSKVGGWKVC